MHIKTIASAIALTAALGLSGYTYAQTMIGNQTVSEADMERVNAALERAFHDAVLATGQMPIEMVRAMLRPDVPLRFDQSSQWRFAQ